MESVTLKLGGMHCAACAQNVERALKKAPGVRGAGVNLADESAAISYDPSATSVESLIQVVRDAGYEAREEATVDEDTEDLERSRSLALQGWLFGAGAAVSAVIMGLSMGGAFAGRDAILLLLATAGRCRRDWDGSSTVTPSPPCGGSQRTWMSSSRWARALRMCTASPWC